MSGQQLRYAVYGGDQLVAMLGFAAAAWKLADRERYVGWTDEQRRSRLHRVVDNTRFLILPWVQCCLRRSCRARATRAPATGPPIGSWWDAPPDAAKPVQPMSCKAAQGRLAIPLRPDFRRVLTDQ